MKFRIRNTRRRWLRALVLGLATAALFAPASSALIPDDPNGYGPNQGGAPTLTGAETAEERALRLRSEALNEQYGVQGSQPVGHRDYADGNIPNVATADSGTSLVSSDAFEWGSVAVGVALVLLLSAFVVTRGRRGRMAHS